MLRGTAPCTGSTPTTWGAAGPQGIDLATAYRLGGVLCARPERLVVLGVQIVDTGLGHGLSPVVAAALPRVADRVLAEFTPG